MAWIRRRWSDQRIEEIISLLLRAGVICAAAIVLLGGILYLLQQGAAAPHYQTFHGEPASLRTVGGIFSAAFAFDSRAIIQLGLLVLILTPIARVAFSAAAFTIQRDRLYVVVTLIVLAVLIVNMVRG